MGEENNNNGNVVQQTTDAGQVGSSEQKQQSVVTSTFTQDQLNSIISGRVNPLNQKITELNNKLAEAEKASKAYQEELTGYKNKEVLANQGIPSEFADYVAFEATKLAVNGKSFEDAVKEFKASHSVMFNVPPQSDEKDVVAKQNQQTKKGTSSVGQQKLEGSQKGGVDSEVEAFLKSRGLKK